jgi:tetratricopeptide (TPR) repeat protein
MTIAAAVSIVLCLLALAQQPAAQQPATPPASDIAAALKDAHALIDKDQTAAAIEKLNALPPAQASDPRVQALLGVAYYHANRLQLAAEILLQAHERLPADSAEQHEAEEALGLTLHLLGRYPAAIPWLERASAHTPANLELSFVLGQACIQARQPDRARQALARAFGLPPDSAAARIAAAQLMMRLQMDAMAEAELTAALEHDPKTPRANYLLGQMALFRGRLDDAVRYSTRELELNPTDAMAFYQMGDAYVRRGQWDDAIRALQRSLWLNPFYSGPYILLGKAYQKRGEPRTAESMLRRAIEYDPNNRTAHYLLAQVLQQTGRAEEARREFSRAEQLQGQAGRPE